MLGTEMVTGFIDVQPGLRDSAIFVAVFGVSAAIPLLRATWASPGRRWQELGLTILLTAGFAIFSGAGTAVVLLDPGAKPFLPPMPGISLAPAIGIANLLVVLALGIALYRGGRRPAVSGPPEEVTPSA